MTRIPSAIRYQCCSDHALRVADIGECTGDEDEGPMASRPLAAGRKPKRSLSVDEPCNISRTVNSTDALNPHTPFPSPATLTPPCCSSDRHACFPRSPIAHFARQLHRSAHRCDVGLSDRTAFMLMLLLATRSRISTRQSSASQGRRRRKTCCPLRTSSSGATSQVGASMGSCACR